MRQYQERMTVFSDLPHQTFMVHGIKAPLMEGVMELLTPGRNTGDNFKSMYKIARSLKGFEKNFPEPTQENTWHPNSHILINIRDEFFKHCQLDERRRRLLRLAINFVIAIYDYDPPYRMMIDWWAQQLKIQNWRYDVPVKLINYNWTWWKP